MSDSVTVAEASTGDDRAFHAVIPGETIQRCVRIVGALVDECRIQLTSDGFRVLAMDPATVAAVDIHLPAEVFTTYKPTEGRLGVDLGRLGAIVGMADADQPVAFRLDTDTRRLHITVGELAYTMALIDPESIRSPPDLSGFDTESLAEVRMSTNQFDRAVRATSMVADHAVLGIDPDDDRFFAEAEGATDDVSLTLTAEDLLSLSPEAARSLFSVDYLADIVGPIPDETAVTLGLGTDQPLLVSFGFADGATVEYQVAPRIASQ